MTSFRPVAIMSLAVLACAVPSAQAAERMVIRGGGFGHGVGMSQYGALGFAEHGAGYGDILAHYYTGTALGKLDTNPTVRVLLQSRPRVSFTGAVQAGDRSLKPGSTYQASGTAAGQVVLRSATGRKLATFAAPLVVVGGSGGPVQVVGGDNSGPYRGALELRPTALGAMNVVNAVDLESYVRGVVSAESPSSWPAEALKAQAVAARTYAITTSKNGDGWDQYADTRSQMYRGVAAETPATDAAVAATAGQVVTYQGKPVTTYFFSTSGGRTENVEFGMPGASPQPWLKSVDDPYDTVSPRHRWGPFTYTFGQAQARLRGLVKGKLKGITVLERGVSPRVVQAQIIGSKGTTVVSGSDLRGRFGLFDTWAYFATIGTKVKATKPPKTTPPGPQPQPGTGAAEARSASVAQVRRGVLSGRVTGVRRGTAVVVQRRTRSGTWTTEGRTRLSRSGGYRVDLGRTGLFRIQVAGFTGPSVRLR